MSAFSSLNVALSGLTAAQRGMDVTGQNVVNATTPGYSRQRVVQAEVAGPVTSRLYTGTAAAFGGVDVTDVTRIKDAFLEATRAAAGARQSALSTQHDILSGVQGLLTEPGDSGVQSAIDAFYSSWHDLANNPGDAAAGAVVLNRGIAVAGQLKALSTGVQQQWAQTHDALAGVVDQANHAARDLADLNGQIAAGEANGLPVNELLDKRDQLVRTLGELVGGTALPGKNGQVSVSVNGVNLVSGTTAQKITLAGAGDLAGAALDRPRLMVGAVQAPVESGTAAGQLAALGTDLPGLATMVDGVATSLRDAVNAVHETGYAADGSTGRPFFAGTDAQSLTVVPTSPDQLATAGAPGVVDGSVAQKIGALSDDAAAATAAGGPGPSVRWRDLTGSLGVQVQSLENAGAIQDSVVATADAAVQSDSGVNTDEEMTNMLLYQRSYQASARVITAIDEVLDTLVNRTGTVGR